MARKPVVCKICGTIFTPNSSTHHYCSPECGREAKRERNHKYYDNNKDRRHCNGPKSKAARKNLAACVKIAREHHMSYGKAQAAGLFNK